MVFQTMMMMIRSRGPDEFWRKRRIYRLAAHFKGRRRNIYSIAVRAVHRALVYATKSRKLKKVDAAELWTTRFNAAAIENNVTPIAFRDGIEKAGTLLNRKALAELAVWEPRTFEALAAVADCEAAKTGKSAAPSNPTGRDHRFSVFFKGIL